VFRERALAQAWGAGAQRERYARLSAFVRRVLETSGMRRLVELGCGRAGLAFDAVAVGARYVGVDFVAEAVAAGREAFAAFESVAFRCADARTLDADVAADSLVVVKEVLQHLSTVNARAILRLAAEAPVALVIEDAADWNLDANRDIDDGAYRPVHLQRAPFDGFGFEPVFRYEIDGCAKQVWLRCADGSSVLSRLTFDDASRGDSGSSTPILARTFHEFGDTWAFLSRVVELALESGHAFQVATRTHASAPSQSAMMTEMLAAMDTCDARIALVDAPGTGPLPGEGGEFSVWFHAQPYRPTRVRWSPSKAGPRVCVQLESRLVRDGAIAEPKGNWSNEYRLLPPHWVPAIRSLLESLGLEVVELDKRLSVDECVEHASRAALFVGIDSGMSHLCHSVGVPVAMYGGHGHLPSGEPYSNRGAHRGKVYDEFVSLAGLESIVRLTLLRLGIPAPPDPVRLPLVSRPVGPTGEPSVVRYASTILGTANAVELDLFANDEFIAGTFAQGSYWNAEKLEMVRALVDPERSVLEVGCHCGTDSVQYASWLRGERASFHGFEPQANLFRLLRRNLERNGLLPRAKLWNAAVFHESSSEGVRMHDTFLDGSSHAARVDARYGSAEPCNFGGLALGTGGEAVATWKLDDLLHAIDNLGFIHSDALGAEPFVFWGARELLRRDRPVIVFEHSPSFVNHVAACHPDVPAEIRTFDVVAFCTNELGYRTARTLQYDDILLAP
jgi:FkbM family methyltransferase